MSGNLKLTGWIGIKANKVLRKVCGILDSSNIPYILEGGTLLGIVRENRLLPWDNDIDLTITEEWMPAVLKLKSRLLRAGCKIKLRRSKEDMPHFPAGSVRLIKIRVKKNFLGRGIGLMDIFVKKKIGDRYYWIVGQYGHVLKSVPCSFYEKRGRYIFRGYAYSVPEDYEGYLNCRYGNWRETVRNYDFKKDDKAIVANRESVKSTLQS